MMLGLRIERLDTMAYEGTCPVESCGHRVTGKTKEEVFTNLQEHHREKHGKDLPVEMRIRVEGAKAKKGDEGKTERETVE